MKAFKKSLSILLTLLMVFSIFTIVSTTASAAVKDKVSVGKVSGDYEYELLENGTAEITKYNGSASELEIPGKLDGYTVTSIGEYACMGCDSFTNVTIPNSVTSIGRFAFQGCGYLKNVTIPNSVTSIGSYAFGDCEALETADLPDSLEELGKGAFSDCTSLKKIYIPDNVGASNAYIFKNCKSAESIYIGASFDGVNGDQFLNCTSVKTVKVNPNNERLCDRDCNGIFFSENYYYKKAIVYGFNSTTLPDDIEEIGNGAFFGMTGLTSVKIPYGCQNIMKLAYANCTNLKSVEIPPSVTSIGEYAFGYYENEDMEFSKMQNGLVIKGYKNSYAEKYALDNGITFEPIGELTLEDSFKYELDEKGNATITKYLGTFTDVKIPAELDGHTVTEIGEEAFSFSVVKTVDIPGSVRSICAFAFSHDNYLYKVNIGDGVEEIRMAAFVSCLHLEAIRIPESVTNIPDMIFSDDTFSDTIVYGKTGSFAETYANEYKKTFVDESKYVEPSDPWARTENTETEPPSEPKNSEAYTFYYLTIKELLEKSSAVTMEVQDINGKRTTYDLKPTSKTYNGVPVYSTELTSGVDVYMATVKYYNGDALQGQVNFSGSQLQAARGKIINSYGDVCIEENGQSVTVKKSNPIKVTVKTKTIKLKKIKKKTQTVKLITIKKAKGTVKVTKVKSGTTAKIYKKIKVNSKTGAITFKKGKYAKKTYKIKLKITVSGNSTYKSKTLYKTVKVKVK